MKSIGLIGGMSWESTVEYGPLINESVKARLGGLHSAQCILYSVDFAEVEALQRRRRWVGAAHLLTSAAQNVVKAGADFAVSRVGWYAIARDTQISDDRFAKDKPLP